MEQVRSSSTSYTNNHMVCVQSFELNKLNNKFVIDLLLTVVIINIIIRMIHIHCTYTEVID